MEIQHREKSFIRISTPSLSASFEYKQKVSIFENINRLLVESGLEDHLKKVMVEAEILKNKRVLDVSDEKKFRVKVAQCLRVNIAKKIYNCSNRGFSEKLSDSTLLQWFCYFDGPDTIKLPGKSILNKLTKFIPTDVIQHFIDC